MNRFVSNFTNRLDAKGRVSIPAPFRAVLARDGFEGLYVHPALDAPALDAGGNSLLNEIDAGRVCGNRSAIRPRSMISACPLSVRAGSMGMM